MRSEFEVERPSPAKKIKLCEDMRQLVQEHGSNRVIGMLQAFTLLENDIRTSLIERERKIV